MENIINTIVKSPSLHVRWLNTLSMMENTGAKKIKNCEHPLLVDEIILKHASEESRHAYYLKKQIHKVEKKACPTYEKHYILASSISYRYLSLLDIQVCRYLKKVWGYTHNDLKYAAYLLVTYAIEVRADTLYPLYQKILHRTESLVNVRGIIVEEMGHLQEMRKQLKAFAPEWKQLCTMACDFETALYGTWVRCLASELGLCGEPRGQNITQHHIAR